MVDGISLSFGIESKPDIESIISSSSLVPEDELYVQRGTDYARKLDGIDSEVSVALVAKAGREFGGLNYTIGYMEKVKVRLNDDQPSPLMINHWMIERAKRDFSDNRVYPEYELEIICPPTELSEFLRSRRALHPRARADYLINCS